MARVVVGEVGAVNVEEGVVVHVVREGAGRHGVGVVRVRGGGRDHPATTAITAATTVTAA